MLVPVLVGLLVSVTLRVAVAEGVAVLVPVLVGLLVSVTLRVAVAEGVAVLVAVMVGVGKSGSKSWIVRALLMPISKPST